MVALELLPVGLATDWQQLQSHHGETAHPSVQLEPDAFPTEWEIQRFLSKLHRDKVPGPNQIPPGVLKAGGPVLAKQLAILYMKASAHCKEPLTWKGGHLVSLWKGQEIHWIHGGFQWVEAVEA